MEANDKFDTVKTLRNDIAQNCREKMHLVFAPNLNLGRFPKNFVLSEPYEDSLERFNRLDVRSKEAKGKRLRELQE